MSHLQWRKLDILDRIGRGELTLAEGARLVGLSRRQLQRLRQKVRADGPKALAHGNTGRAPAHKTAEPTRDRVVELARGKYAGFNDEHFTEKLYSDEGIDLARQTVRRILRAAGLASPRKRRAATHRRRAARGVEAGRGAVHLARPGRPALRQHLESRAGPHPAGCARRSQHGGESPAPLPIP